ncbi:MAG: FIST C-terminal domain-containing protein [bacterium]|nr:FIST C-terminal domain-containing protein [bacterium]
MKVASAASTQRDPATAVRDAASVLRATLGGDPGLVIVSSSSVYDIGALRGELAQQFPSAMIHGATSCLGVMTEQGYACADGYGVGLFALSDHDGYYGTGAAELGGDPAAATRLALERALAAAGMPGCRPDLVWLSAAPGDEEAILATLRATIGPDVPVIGGTAADNTIAGEWWLHTRDFQSRQAVVLTVMFPGSRFAFAFHSGYAPAESRGSVTRASGRTVFEIDHRPAADVYDEWTAGSIATQREGGGTILGQTTLHPLGRIAHSIQGISYYKLSHPEAVTEDGALTLFTNVAVGDEFHLLEGSRASLVERAGRVAAAAVDSVFGSVDEVAGALVIYCAGCMLTVRDQMDNVVGSIDQALHGRPFLGAFTFGEQGCFVGGENHHGNLMISILVFGR